MCMRWGSRDSFVILCSAGSKHEQNARAMQLRHTYTHVHCTRRTHQSGVVRVSNSKSCESHHIRTDAHYAIPLERSEGFYERQSAL